AGTKQKTMDDRCIVDEGLNLALAKSILRAGRKVFLRHENPLDRDDDDGSSSSASPPEVLPGGGVYRLVRVHESFDYNTGSFKVIWRRRGKGTKVVSYDLISSDQVLLEDYTNRIVFVEHEYNVNGPVHDARIIDMLDGGGRDDDDDDSDGIGHGDNYDRDRDVRPGDVLIRWDRGDEEMEMLDKALECRPDSNEFSQTVTDAGMLLQEVTYNLNERTMVVDAPSGKEQILKRKEDGNEKDIIDAAEELGLSTPQICKLLANLNPENGYYSINDALVMIRQMQGEEVADSSHVGLDDEDCRYDSVLADPNAKPLALVGSRVRTVFEDGKDYEGTITHVHHRVVYDDGQTETFDSEAELCENLACNDMVLRSSSFDELRCTVLELFSGCSLLSNLCQRKGMDCMSIDIDINSNATIKSDFSSDYIQTMLSSMRFDYIHASPVCSTYSHLAGGKHRDKSNYNKTRESHEADRLLMQLYFFIAKKIKINNGITITIENPRGWMRCGNIMKELFEKELGFIRNEIYYCQFGRGEQKPTNIWTNDDKLGRILETIGGKCNCPRPHEEGVRSLGGGACNKNFAALPMKLCQVISDYVKSKHTQLKFDDLLQRHSC
ncbi:hypothetical protein ACHAXA_006936, partial [Cyclostephanos tholiformis]